MGNQRTRHEGKSRRGTAAVEFAVCLPILLTIVLGSIEATNAIFLKEHLTTAAYEGARSATTPGQTITGATEAANQVLAQFGILGGAVAITPAITVSTPTGTPVTVSVSAPLGPNSYMQPFIVGKVINNVTATVVMIHQ
jgi:Flp pilus assembly protein TadG